MGLFDDLKKLGRGVTSDPVGHFKAGATALGADVKFAAKKTKPVRHFRAGVSALAGDVKPAVSGVRGLMGGRTVGQIAFPPAPKLSVEALIEHKRVVVPKPPTLREFQLSFMTSAEKQGLLSLSATQQKQKMTSLAPILSGRAQQVVGAVREIQARTPGMSAGTAARKLRTIARERERTFVLPPSTAARGQARGRVSAQRQEVRATQSRRRIRQRIESAPPARAPAPPPVATPTRPRRRPRIRNLF